MMLDHHHKLFKNKQNFLNYVKKKKETHELTHTKIYVKFKSRLKTDNNRSESMIFTFSGLNSNTEVRDLKFSTIYF